MLGALGVLGALVSWPGRGFRGQGVCGCKFGVGFSVFRNMVCDRVVMVWRHL